MKFRRWLSFLPLFIAAPALSEVTPAPGNADSRVRLVNYDPNQVYKINGVFRSATQIVFGNGEEVVSAALGDSISWEIAPAGNSVFLKPRETAGPTNLIVMTKRGTAMRIYNFALSVRSGTIVQGSDAVFQIRFRYPAEEIAAAQAEALRLKAAEALAVEAGVVKMVLDAAVTQGPRNLSYTLAGSSELQPSEVSDNGVFTVLRFPRSQAVPAIFTVSPDGDEEVVSYDVRGEFVVIHRVVKELRLRQGRALLCIWNNAFDRIGGDLSSGTASPDIERITEKTDEN